MPYNALTNPEDDEDQTPAEQSARQLQQNPGQRGIPNQARQPRIKGASAGPNRKQMASNAQQNATLQATPNVPQQSSPPVAPQAPGPPPLPAVGTQLDPAHIAALRAYYAPQA